MSKHINLFHNKLKTNDFVDYSIIEQPIAEALASIKSFLSDRFPAEFLPWKLEDYPLLRGQAIYVVDYKKGGIIYHKGLNDMLGYSDEEFTIDLLTSFIHPDQKEIVLRLAKGALNYGLNDSQKLGDSFWIYLCYKVQKKDGTYIPVMRQSATYQSDREGRMLSAYNIMFDMSGMVDSDCVTWRVGGSNIHEENFNNYMRKAFYNYFSKREWEVLQCLTKGSSSKEIAEKLFISRYTVDTHRRNMLKKANCTNSIELVQFARKNGIL